MWANPIKILQMSSDLDWKTTGKVALSTSVSICHRTGVADWISKIILNYNIDTYI